MDPAVGRDFEVIAASDEYLADVTVSLELALVLLIDGVDTCSCASRTVDVGLLEPWSWSPWRAACVSLTS